MKNDQKECFAWKSLFYEQRKKDRQRDRQTWRQRKRKRQTDREKEAERDYHFEKKKGGSLQ